MNVLEKMVDLERAYLRTFTSCERREWGYLYFNEDQPNYYDANHAEIMDVPENPAAVVNEVVEFYQSKGLVPRWYIYEPEKQAGLLAVIEAHGFRWERLDSILQQWNGSLANIAKDEWVTIEEVTSENVEEAIAVEVTIHELGGEIRREALLEEMTISGFTHYLLRYKGVACSTACIFHDGTQARLEAVATLAEYRGKGLIGHLIRHIQEVVMEKGYTHLWVFPITNQVEKVYARYGFESIVTVQVVHAFASGKSIMEIRAEK